VRELLPGGEEDAVAVLGDSRERGAVRTVPSRRPDRDLPGSGARVLVDVLVRVHITGRKLLEGAEVDEVSARGCAGEIGVEVAVAAGGAGRDQGRRTARAVVDVLPGV